ncbi:VanZ family protein [Pseudobutyrivibrio sp.]|uniref:VanZ family protein n=1 Tax=Pseudobutyrivibrio sp. TaxID=2014367 RepID=UPI003868B0E0
MLEINIQMIVGFITLCWIITRLAVFLLKKEFNILRELQLILVYICLVVIARMTLLPLHHVDGHIGTIIFDASKILPFWMNLKPFTFVNDFYDGWQVNIIGNIAMFIPVGIVWPVCFKKLNTLGKSILAGGGFSLFIEIAQLLFFDHCSDVDDLILNTTGVVIGSLIYFGIKKATQEKK